MEYIIEQLPNQEISVKVKSTLTGKENAMVLPITIDNLEKWINGTDLIQKVFPDLNSTQREFLLSGMSEEEQKDFYDKVEDNINNVKIQKTKEEEQKENLIQILETEMKNLASFGRNTKDHEEVLEYLKTGEYYKYSENQMLYSCVNDFETFYSDYLG